MTDVSKILYVDDEVINQHLFKINLSKHYNVITGSDGAEGLEILKNDKEIKLVISDMKMPIMNGIDFIKKAKLMYPNLPFFLLTGFDITPEINEAINSKLIISHLRKPFDITQMLLAFSKALA